jgi:hypothetical protein
MFSETSGHTYSRTSGACIHGIDETSRFANLPFLKIRSAIQATLNAEITLCVKGSSQMMAVTKKGQQGLADIALLHRRIS